MKNFYPILIINLILCIASFSQAESKIELIKTQEAKSFDAFKTKYGLKEPSVNKVVAFSPSSKNLKSAGAEIISDFTAKKYAPDSSWFVAFYEGEVNSKYIGFFNEKDEMYFRYEINIDPAVNFSSKGDYLVVYSLFSNYFYCFSKKGKLLYNNSVNEIQKSENTFYNAFLDDEGKYVLLNTSYKLLLFDIDSESTLWSTNIESRRIKDCIFSDKNGIITKSLLSREKQDGSDKYSVNLFTLETGEELGRIENISNMLVIDNKLIIQSKNKWEEYEIR